ncbi:hypothetical protein HXX76_000827 [Chlamydomonas incerta]|uniref:Prenylcysteine lyase domain-containing protein n=1 Tax=Chlamydomonas incerta TaxID=51695 RepID=A0A835WFN9_CHLIN|nr:hypothetical protein HXX76_000827 [Chlamydomonas incerta]|eukprot:KAG2446235.1 hypothetical protein HXX76_000827 [Chlamydomonas incerta]
MFWDYNRYVKAAAESLGLTLKAHHGGGSSSSSHDRASAAGEPLPTGPNIVEAAGKEDGGPAETGGGTAAAAATRRQQQRPAGDGPGGGLSLWDGERLVFNMSGSWWDVARAAVRYGTAALAYRWRVAGAFRRFQRVYDLQAAGVSWETPDAMLQQLGLFNQTQRSSRDYMEAHLLRPAAWWLWGGRAFIEEAAAAVGRCNYNQRTDQLNALAGLVSYGPAAYGSVWAIEGGNRKLVSGLLAASGARLLRGGRVRAARRHAGTGLWWLEVEGQGAGAAAAVYGPYQAVVLAAPLVGSGLVIEKEVEEDELVAGVDSSGGGGGGSESSNGFSRDSRAAHNAESVGGDERPGLHQRAAATRRRLLFSDLAGSYGGASQEHTSSDIGSSKISSSSRATGGDTAALLQRPYQVTITTFVAAGRLRPAFFNATALPPGLSAVLVTDSARVPFAAVAARRLAGPAGGEGNDEVVYKLFSSEPLAPELLERLFEPGPAQQAPRVLASRRWYAYPRFAPPERFPPFLLGPGLVYGNALEPAASAMEMAAVAAANSALLVARHLQAAAAAAAVRQ